MKKIVPFKHEIIFENGLEEITGISLEHTLHVDGKNLITGDFIVSGEYKTTDSSITTENFLYQIPFDIELDEHYLLEHVTVDISDFYYEILEHHSLVLNIEVTMDGLEEKPLLEEVKEEERSVESAMEEKEEVIPIPVEVEEEVLPVFQEEKKESLFENLKEGTETYSTYHVYIVREGDTLDSILLNYQVSKEELEAYNDLSDLKLGDKLIIPSIKNDKKE